jgi:hypothetical protein
MMELHIWIHHNIIGRIVLQMADWGWFTYYVCNDRWVGGKKSGKIANFVVLQCLAEKSVFY